MAREKILHLRALGAEVRLTRSDVGKGHPDYYQDMAEAHRRRDSRARSSSTSSTTRPIRWRTRPTTGPEIWEQMERRRRRRRGRRRLRRHADRARPLLRARPRPKTEMVLADPVGSILAPLVETGEHVEAGSWVVEGIGEDFVPPTATSPWSSKAYAIPDRESFATARELLRHEGILGGSSIRHAAGRGAALLPRADRAEAGRHLGLRHRQQVPLQDVQRLSGCSSRASPTRHRTATCAT